MRLIILLLLLGISSLISINYANAEEILVQLELIKGSFEVGEPIVLKITVEKIVPSAPLSLQIFHDGIPLRSISKNGASLHEETIYKIISLDDQPSGIYEVFAYYGILSTENKDNFTTVIGSLDSNSITMNMILN